MLDFLKEVATTDYEPLEEDWYELRDNCKKLKDRLKKKYWDEIIYSNVEDILFQVHHGSDVRFTESWIGNFYDYMNGISSAEEIYEFDYDQMIEYCKTLKFDAIGHEVHMPQVVAWNKRHKGGK